MKVKEQDGTVRAGAMQLKELMLEAAQETNEQPDQPEEESAAQEEEQAEVEAEDTEETSEETEEEEGEGPELFDIKANGETHQLEWEEIQKLAAAGFDYTKKSQELTERVKTEAEKLAKEQTVELEKHRSALIEKTELVESLFNQPLVSKEKLEQLLSDGDTEEYLRLKGQEESRMNLLQQVKIERENNIKQQQEEQSKAIQAEAQKQTAILLDKVPSLKEKANQEKLLGYLKSQGLTEQEIGGLYDARFLQIAEKARMHDELIKEGVKPKKKAKTPNVTKKKGLPASKTTKAKRADQVLADKFKKSGKTRDAAELIKQMGL